MPVYSKNKKYHYVYEILNTVENKRYIGKRSCGCPIEEDDYMGSGVEIQMAINKYGLENFQKNILAICATSEDAHMIEGMYIKKRGAKQSPDYYNRHNGDEPCLDNHSFLYLYPSNTEYPELVKEINEHKYVISKMNSRVKELAEDLSTIKFYEDNYSYHYSSLESELKRIKNYYERKLESVKKDFERECEELERNFNFEQKMLEYENNRILINIKNKHEELGLNADDMNTIQELYDNLRSSYRELNEEYLELLNSHHELEKTYHELLDTYDKLKDEYRELRSNN